LLSRRCHDEHRRRRCNSFKSTVHDALDRPAAITYSDGHTPHVAYTYTPTGLRQSVTDGTGTTSYGYDALDRTVAVTNGAGQTVGYAYNPVDDTTAITYPGGVAVSRTFDALDRVTSLRDWLGHTTTYGYDPAGNPISETLPNTTSVVWGYDAADRLVGITRTAPLTAPRVYAYTRDGLGQLTGATDSAEPTAHGYGYTALNQLRSDTTGITYTASSANDLLGITSTAGGAPSTSSLGYDAAHELTGTRVLAGGVLAHNLTLAYNPDGDRTAVTDTVGSAATSYAYDQADRLVGVTSGGATSSYAYDGDGLRQGKTVSGVSSADTWDVSGSLPTLLQENGTRYIDGPNGQSIEQIDGSGNALYYYQDQLGSTRELADGSGHIAATYRYDAYGNPLTRTGTATTPFGYAGEYTDAETGLQYLRARYYDPATSQFLTRDPLVATTGQPYAYAATDPLNLTDPSGLCDIALPFAGRVHVPGTADDPYLCTDKAAQAVLTGLSNFNNSGLSTAVNTGFNQAVIGLGGVFFGTPTVAGGPSSPCDTAYYAQAARAQEDLNTDTSVASLGLLGAGGIRSLPSIARGIAGFARGFARGLRGLDSVAEVGSQLAKVDPRKFSEYIFKPGATHGKDVVFRSLGYDAEDSQMLTAEYERQAAEKFANGQYTLGKADQYGQRINIEIELHGTGSAAGKTSYLVSGWIIREDGSITLNTPFSGFTRR